MSSQSFKEFIQGMITGKVEPPPVGKTVGFRLVACENGESKFEMKADKRHHNPMGTMHGGVMCDITDAAMGVAFASTLEDGETFTTVNFQINFFKAIIEEDLVATAKVIRRGKTLGYIESDLIDSKGNLVAKAQSTCMVLKRK